MLSTEFYRRCISTLQKAHQLLLSADAESIEHDMYRSACIKEFEIILEQSGKLLKKTLRPYFASAKAADRLFFKDIFRHAALHDMLTAEACERWLQYRDNRNNTSHDYGADFAEEVIQILPGFISDALALADVIDNAKTD